MRSNASSRLHCSPARHSRLVDFLAVAYTVLVACASLYPFSPWRAQASGPFAFLSEPWPPYYTASDVALNVLGYLPLGLLATLLAMTRASPRWAVLIGTAAGASLSLVLETLQNYLPPRVPSNLDLLSNGLGALAGALLAVAAGERWLLSNRLYRWRERTFVGSGWADAGFVVLILWLLIQLYPTVWLFGSGDLRFLFEDPHNLAFSPGLYRWIEAGITSLNLAGVALVIYSLARVGQNVVAPLLVVGAAALLLKGVAAVTLLKSSDASLWLTPGGLLGIPAGLALYLVLLWLPRPMLPAVAGVLLLAGAALVNIAPENPYILASIQNRSRGHILSFNGTTRLVSSLWPFLAAGYLFWWTGYAALPRRAPE